jgi:chromosomal replication initiator protein
VEEQLMQPDQLDRFWTDVQAHLRRTLPGNVFQIWIEPLKPAAVADRTVFLEAPAATREWVRRRFGSLLLGAVASVDPSVDRLELLTGTNSDAAPQAAAEAQRERSHLTPAYSFDEFVIGAGNRFGHAAALAVAELPGQAYNPLFLYGPPGVGKTHLLHAIGNYIALHDSSLHVRYTTVEQFTTQFTGSLQSGLIADFKRMYREPDVLLLDDVQFLEHKEKTSEELFHTFDELLSNGAQVVVSSDRAPSAMPALHERLRERFEGGLLVEIDPPDFDARLAILHKRAGVDPQPDQLAALEYLATRIPPNVRSLEGALIRVRAFASLTEQPLTLDVAQHVLSSLYPDAPDILQSAPSLLSVEQIQSKTCDQLDLAPSDLASPKRSRRVVYARQVAMYLCRELTPLSLPAIAQRFGGRDHTTVLHAHRRIRDRLSTDESTRAVVEAVLNALQGPPGA